MTTSSQTEDLTARTAANKAIGVRAQHELLIAKDFSAMDRYWADPYLQHNRYLPDGLAAFSEFKEANVPNATTEIIRVVGDDDLVFFHQRVTGFMPQALVFFDLYRIENGKIVEHWDAWQNEEGPSPDGHGMFDGPTEVSDHDQTETNRALVSELFNRVLIPGTFDALGDYVADGLIQHSPRVADGIAGLLAYREAEEEAGRAISYDTLHMLITEGNFAVSACTGAVGGVPHVLWDVWRIEEGKVVEHWDTVQDLPETTVGGRPIF